MPNFHVIVVLLLILEVHESFPASRQSMRKLIQFNFALYSDSIIFASAVIPYPDKNKVQPLRVYGEERYVMFLPVPLDL